MNYIVRKNQIERVWQVRYKENGFEYSLFIRGTEAEMQCYMDSEMEFVGSYYAINDAEIEMVKKLGMKIYIAPQLSDYNE